MSTAFDPYHKWLGIPLKHRPPNHYRLLGIEPFEADQDVIHSAADQRIAFLQALVAGEYAVQAKKLLDELIAARDCLTDLERKSAYDGRLRVRIITGRLRAKQGTLVPDLQKGANGGAPRLTSSELAGDDWQPPPSPAVNRDEIESPREFATSRGDRRHFPAADATGTPSAPEPPAGEPNTAATDSAEPRLGTEPSGVPLPAAGATFAHEPEPPPIATSEALLAAELTVPPVPNLEPPSLEPPAARTDPSHADEAPEPPPVYVAENAGLGRLQRRRRGERAGGATRRRRACRGRFHDTDLRSRSRGGRRGRDRTQSVSPLLAVLAGMAAIVLLVLVVVVASGWLKFQWVAERTEPPPADSAAETQPAPAASAAAKPSAKAPARRAVRSNRRPRTWNLIRFGAAPPRPPRTSPPRGRNTRPLQGAKKPLWPQPSLPCTGEIDQAVTLLERSREFRKEHNRVSAQQLLEEIDRALSDAKAREVLNGLSDEELDRVRTGELSLANQLAFRYPVLQERFQRTLRENVTAVKRSRPGSQPALARGRRQPRSRRRRSCLPMTPPCWPIPKNCSAAAA